MHPNDDNLAYVTGSDGRLGYVLHFYDEGLAVITEPSPPGAGRLVRVDKLCKLPAKDADDARAKVEEWMRTPSCPASPRGLYPARPWSGTTAASSSSRAAVTHHGGVEVRRSAG